MLTMKQLASLEKQGGGSGKRCSLPESGGRIMHFSMENQSRGGSRGGFASLYQGGGGGRP